MGLADIVKRSLWSVRSSVDGALMRDQDEGLINVGDRKEQCPAQIRKTGGQVGC